jgi:hypothetical protein
MHEECYDRPETGDPANEHQTPVHAVRVLRVTVPVL